MLEGESVTGLRGTERCEVSATMRKWFVSAALTSLLVSSSVSLSVAQPTGPAPGAPPPPPPAAPPIAPTPGDAELSSPKPATSLTTDEITGAATQDPLELQTDSTQPDFQPRATSKPRGTPHPKLPQANPNFDADTKARLWELRHHASLNASTGMLRTHYAGSGPVGSFRFGVLGSYFTGSGFLCPQCTDADGGPGFIEDDVSRVAGHVLISATPFDYLEAYFGIHSSATSNSRGAPELLQVLGDTTWGVKGFIPKKPNQWFTAGGALELLLLNGAGGVGIDTASVALRGLATADFNEFRSAKYRLPLRVNFNLSYVFDNSGSLIDEVEAEQGLPISRIDRYGLNINRVDRLTPALGVEGTFQVVQPYLEWSIDIPSNRQGHSCVVADLYPSDRCLETDPSITSAPARLTLGARGVLPMMQQLAFNVALDFATGGVSAPFWEEVQPETPWNLHFGVSYAVDLKPQVKLVPVRVPAAEDTEGTGDLQMPPQYFVEGVVVEQGAESVSIPGAILRYEGRSLTGMVAGAAGEFRTSPLEPGTYTFAVSAADYEDGTCRAIIDPGNLVSPQGTGGVTAIQSGQAALTQAETSVPEASADSGGVARVQCELKPKPRVGNVDGFLVDGLKKSPVSNAEVNITDSLGRTLTLDTDAQGAFRFENVPPGKVTLSVKSRGYMPTSALVEILPREDVRTEIPLFKKPRRPTIIVTRKELRLRRPITFAYGTAVLDAPSQAIVDELGVLLNSRSKIGPLEIQAHSDNTAGASQSLQLTVKRAHLIRDMLIRAGVKESRLRFRGYGDTSPLKPNDTPSNRAQNERIQLVIVR